MKFFSVINIGVGAVGGLLGFVTFYLLTRYTSVNANPEFLTFLGGVVAYSVLWVYRKVAKS